MSIEQALRTRPAAAAWRHHDPECAGPDGLRAVQRLLYARRGELATQPASFSQGRSFGLLHASRADVIRRTCQAGCPPRLLVHLPAADVDAVREALTSLGYRSPLTCALMAGTAATVRRQSAALVTSTSCHGTTSVLLDGRTGRDTVHALQALQQARELTPIPGWVLRGHDGCTRTHVLLDRHGQVRGGVSAQPVRYRGRAAALGFGLCMAAALDGRGLARRLNAVAMADAVAAGACWLLEIVAVDNHASRRVNEACGLACLAEESILFAELAHAVTAASADMP